MAQTLRFQADRLFYQGDFKAAIVLADQATEAATRASDRSLPLAAQVMAATTRRQATEPGTGGAAREPLRTRTDWAPVDGGRVRGRQAGTLLKLGDRAGSQPGGRPRPGARRGALGFRVLAAKAHYLRAEAMRATGDAEAKRKYRLAVRLLNDLSREDGNQNVLKRADLAAMYQDAKTKS